MEVPFHRPSIGDEEIDEVIQTLRSGWLTTGAKTRLFEQRFAAAVGAPLAVAVGSCTAALHLALEALGLGPGDAVLVPTMTFAATAEVVRHLGAQPLFVDCAPDTLLIDLEHARARAAEHVAGGGRVAGILPVHVGGVMVDLARARAIADEVGGWVVEDAAHAFPAAWRPSPSAEWRVCGSGEADVTCFSFYANKTITTGEGGMAVTRRPELEARMRAMSLHGLSRDAWRRDGDWSYEILAAGFKYNMTDLQAALGIHQLARAEALREERAAICAEYGRALAACEEVELPPQSEDRRSSHHLYYLRLRLDRLRVDRATFIQELASRGVRTSVHWRPLHLHAYWRGGVPEADSLPVATALWPRLVSLPIFPDMSAAERRAVTDAVLDVCRCERLG